PLFPYTTLFRSVEAQGHLLGIRTEPGEEIGIAADISRNVSVAAARGAVFLEENVDAFVQAHQRERHRVVAGREHDREMALGKGEFLDGQRNRVLVADPCRLIYRT